MSTRATKKPKQATLLEVPATEKTEEAEETKSSARFSSPRPFRQWQPEQGQLLPQYVREVLGEGHLACFFVDLAQTLDFSPILSAYTQECGQPPYYPVMRTLLLMYAYSRGITSSREIERRSETDLALRYLTGGETPDHDTVCTFRSKAPGGLSSTVRRHAEGGAQGGAQVRWATCRWTARSGMPMPAALVTAGPAEGARGARKVCSTVISSNFSTFASAWRA